MKFDKFQLGYILQREGIGRKYLLERILTKSIPKIVGTELDEFKGSLKELGVEIISFKENSYPYLLKEIYDFPLILFCKGDVSLLSKKMITIVGTREMSSYGKWSVEYILGGLKSADIVVVSGLARGIDGWVHRSCLRLGIKTIAIVAGGIDVGYPKSNFDLYKAISKEGLILSEFPSGRKIFKGMFPMRNRILAGISLATVVVESGVRGGSLITAQLALECGREIYGVPCCINRFALQGCNRLLEQGAIPLYSPSQILEFLNN